jgi:DNA-binding response OmpR family regulator|tara:strand:- start:9262 stop:9942 length:681 start_codon:yes stop_codon:yes gene_type:complete
MTYKILICEDDKLIASSISEYLQALDYKISVVNDGEKAIKEFNDFKPDLILLDVMMPKLNGIEVIKIIRNKSRTPIIFLTAKISVDEKILGLELGADDYIGKPFSMRELLLRIKVILRRNLSENNEQIISYGNINLFPQKREVIIKKNIASLTKTEFDFLECLLKNYDQVLSRDQILEYSKLDDYLDSYDRVVDVHIKNLRKKLDKFSSDIKILTVRSLGYRATVE